MTQSIVALDLAFNEGRAPSPEVEQEQRVAVFDLLEQNRFQLAGGPEGPYRLSLGLEGRRLRFDPAELRAWVDAGCPTEPGAAKRVRAAMRKGARR